MLGGVDPYRNENAMRLMEVKVSSQRERKECSPKTATMLMLQLYSLYYSRSFGHSLFLFCVHPTWYSSNEFTYVERSSSLASAQDRRVNPLHCGSVSIALAASAALYLHRPKKEIKPRILTFNLSLLRAIFFPSFRCLVRLYETRMAVVLTSTTPLFLVRVPALLHQEAVSYPSSIIPVRLLARQSHQNHQRLEINTGLDPM